MACMLLSTWTGVLLLIWSKYPHFMEPGVLLPPSYTSSHFLWIKWSQSTTIHFNIMCKVVNNSDVTLCRLVESHQHFLYSACECSSLKISVLHPKLCKRFCYFFRFLAVLTVLNRRLFTTEAHFDSRPACVESVVNELAVCCVFSGILPFYTILIIQSMLHTHVFATESI